MIVFLILRIKAILPSIPKHIGGGEGEATSELVRGGQTLADLVQNNKISSLKPT